jgi:hypothetical protein
MATNYASYEWYIRQDLSKYAGRWVSIVDKKIVAAGTDLKQVLEETKMKTSRRPLLARISNKLRIL